MDWKLGDPRNFDSSSPNNLNFHLMYPYYYSYYYSPANNNNNNNNNWWMDYSNNGYFQYQNQFPPYFVQPQFQTLDSQLRDADHRHRHGLPYNPYLTPSPSNMFLSQAQFSGIFCRSKYHRESMRAVEEAGPWRRTMLRHPTELITRKEDGVSVSPPHDVIIEILVRLPAKSIVRFRLVCKLWHTLTQDGHFIKRHFEHTSNIDDDLGIIGVYHSLPSSPRKLFIHFHVNGFHEFDITDHFTDGLWKMSNPCDGLICAYGKTICVVNPSIRQVLQLPKIEYPKTENRAIYFSALGKNMCTGEYKVVTLFRRRDYSMVCEIFSLGSHSWRTIQGPPALISFAVSPQVVNGIIYWATDLRAKPKLLVSFDTEKETFDVIMQPVGFSRGAHLMSSVLEGHLCLTFPPELGEQKKVLKMWVLQDKDNEGNITWKEHHISMGSFRRASWMRPVTTTIHRDDRRKKILWQTDEATFFYYDVTSGMLTSTMCGHNYSYPVYPYRESLISPIAIHEKSSVPDDGGIVLKNKVCLTLPQQENRTSLE